MSQNSFPEFMNVAQNRTACPPFYDPYVLVEPGQSDESPIFESVATKQEYSKMFMLIYSITAGHMENILADESKDTENIVVPPPPKRILASVEVELSQKDFKRRLPKPVILLD